jgi:subtilase family serine protease
MRRRALTLTMTTTLAGLAGALVLSGPALASPVGPSGSGSGPSTSVGVSDACDSGTGNSVVCSAVELDNSSGWRGHHSRGAAAGTAAAPAGYGPSDLQAAYNLTAASSSGGRGETVAVVDAYDDPYALANLASYRAEYGLPPLCGGWISRGCVTFSKVNQEGQPFPLPSPDPGWSQEISVDVDTVSAICPNCNILLVEADAATIQSLGTAEDAAAAAGAVSIGNSFGVSETRSESSDDRYFDHPGVAVTAASGDDGYGTQYPAASPDVIAVGGTTLSTDSGSSRGFSETAWSGDGSGCSTVEPQPRWQKKVTSISGECSGRAIADIAAVADPGTGVAVYDTFELPGWTVFGGTSVSAQIIAAVYGLAGNAGSSSTAAGLYAAAPASFFDVTSGSDGSCGSDLCTAGTGWDGPTGLGTPDGTSGF